MKPGLCWEGVLVPSALSLSRLCDTPIGLQKGTEISPQFSFLANPVLWQYCRKTISRASLSWTRKTFFLMFHMSSRVAFLHCSCNTLSEEYPWQFGHISAASHITIILDVILTSGVTHYCRNTWNSPSPITLDQLYGNELHFPEYQYQVKRKLFIDSVSWLDVGSSNIYRLPRYKTLFIMKSKSRNLK